MWDQGYGILFHGTQGTLFVDRSRWEILPEMRQREAETSGQIARLLPDPCPVAPAEVATQYRDAFYRLQGDAQFSEPLFPGVAETLAMLRHPEIFLAIATGKNRRGLAMGLARHGLASAFHFLKTADDGPGKPHPAILEQAMDEAAVAPGQTVLVGDTTFDMEMAVNAGVAAIGVSWGYHAPARLLEAGACAVLECMTDLSPGA